MEDFEKVLIKFDEERYNRTLKSAQDKAIELTERYNKVAEFLERELTGEDIMGLNTNNMQYIDSLLKPQFQFPNASKDFNLESMGIKDEYYALTKHANGLGTLFNSEGYDFVNNEVVLTAEGIERIKRRNEIWSKNKKQTDAFLQAGKVVEELNKLFKILYLPDNKHPYHALVRGTGMIEYNYKEFVLAPNYFLFNNI